MATVTIAAMLYQSQKNAELQVLMKGMQEIQGTQIKGVQEKQEKLEAEIDELKKINQGFQERETRRDEMYEKLLKKLTILTEKL
jgi:hypothetical protein